jgi:hypothetical protein
MNFAALPTLLAGQPAMDFASVLENVQMPPDNLLRVVVNKKPGRSQLDIARSPKGVGSPESPKSP